VLATGFRPAPLNLPIVFSKSVSRGFTQLRRHRRHRIGDIGAAFWDRAVAITTTITIGWLPIGHISPKRRLGERPPLGELGCAPRRHRVRLADYRHGPVVTLSAGALVKVRFPSRD